MARLFLLCLVLPLDVVLAVASTASAQDAVSDTQANSKQWFEQRRGEIGKYRFTIDSAEPQELALEPQSLLNWSNAERGADVGAVYLWTRNGLPQLIACAFGRGKLLRHEFHSLSTEPVVAEQDGNQIHRFEPGVVWQELPEAPAPAKQRVMRLTQMRRQAERFRVVLGEKNLAEMRLLTRPLFRTTAELENDVAMFGFVQGTDPECMLLVQATAEGKWQYAVTRQTKWPVKVELDSKQVAEFPSFGRKPTGSPFLVLKPPAAIE